jgi:hypothetical protein
MANTIPFFSKSSPCNAAEALFADALDGILSPADQAFFDQHLAACPRCPEAFTQASRGAEWLALLKSPAPEPPADLVARIISQTSEATAAAEQPHLAPVIAFPPQRSRFTQFVRAMHEPRLAMTAAMAFFSISLTLNLTGARLNDIHASSLSPNALRRSYYEANSSAIRFYDNLKFVRALESRVDDIRQSSEYFHPSDSNSKPEQPSQQPDQNPDQKNNADPNGSSRRTPYQSRPTFQTVSLSKSPRSTQKGGLA